MLSYPSVMSIFPAVIPVLFVLSVFTWKFSILKERAGGGTPGGGGAASSWRGGGRSGWRSGGRSSLREGEGSSGG